MITSKRGLNQRRHNQRTIMVAVDPQNKSYWHVNHTILLQGIKNSSLSLSPYLNGRQGFHEFRVAISNLSLVIQGVPREGPPKHIRKCLTSHHRRDLSNLIVSKDVSKSTIVSGSIFKSISKIKSRNWGFCIGSSKWMEQLIGPGPVFSEKLIYCSCF